MNRRSFLATLFIAPFAAKLAISALTAPRVIASESVRRRVHRLSFMGENIVKELKKSPEFMKALTEILEKAKRRNS